MFIVLISFSTSLVTKCLFLNDESCMVRPTLIDLNPVGLKYYSFMISLDKCTRSCNVLSPKICVPKETKDICKNIFACLFSVHNKIILSRHEQVCLLVHDVIKLSY